MKSLSHVFKTVLLVGVSTSVAQVAYAQKSAIDTERENIIIFSRQGDVQLNQAIPKLEALFKRTQDSKVRDDLMTLYLRTNQSAKALSLCESCAPAQFSQNELENLGKNNTIVPLYSIPNCKSNTLIIQMDGLVAH